MGNDYRKVRPDTYVILPPRQEKSRARRDHLTPSQPIQPLHAPGMLFYLAMTLRTSVADLKASRPAGMLAIHVAWSSVSLMWPTVRPLLIAPRL